MNPLLAAIITGITALLLWVAFDYFYAPWRAKRIVDRILENKTEANPRVREDAKHGAISCDDAGLRVKIKDQEAGIEWAWVDEVYAYKADLFTTDMICLSLVSHARKLALEIHEEMAGYHDAQAFLEKSLPGYSNAWFSTVAFPAFVENRTLVWKRTPATLSS